MAKASILIVEDEAIVARDLAQKLAGLGHAIMGTTARGEEAVALARERRPSLVLMDVRLEGEMDGVEAARRIRQECDIPIVYLTAYSDSATLERAKLTEPYGYILKPFEERELESHIQMALYKHQAERELRQHREWLQVTLQSIGDAVITTDATGMVTSLNPTAEKLTGWKVAEALGRPLTEVFEIVNEDNRLGAPDPVEQVLREGKVVGLGNHTTLIARDGREIAIRDSAAPIKDELGRLFGVVMVFHDVTEKRRAEAAQKEAQRVLTRSKEELEALVAERTSKLHELVGELEHFSYSITHDLKSPLRAMRGFAEMAGLMCMEGDQARAKEFLGRISTAAERMDHLIADALSYSRSVRQELPLEDVDAGVLLRGMLDSYPELQAEKARIRVEGRLPVVLANQAGLTQCFSNLLGNAVKFVKRGEVPDIRVRAEHREGWVRIWVEDNGIGVAKDMLPRMFEMFARGSKDYEGTGIGLALVRKVAQRMGGRVGLESEEGKGSRFWIELKSGEGEALLNAALARKAEDPEAGGGTVLYVEDEESDAMFMEHAFAGRGLSEKLRVVRDGRAAINYLSGSGEYSDRKKYPVPTVVLVDLNLPNVSGFEVLRWMRNHPDFAKTPVIIFSSSTREDDKVKAQRLGANEFVSKPSSAARFNEVAAALREKWMGSFESRVP